MHSTVTASYDSREAADQAREALRSIGVPAAGISIREPVQQAGVFDHLARMIAPDKAADTSGEGYRLSAEIAPERIAQAMLILGAAGTSGAAAHPGPEQIFEFAETREELRVEKRTVVSEEVVLRKQVKERIADVSGTVRRTEVEIEQIPAPSAPAAPLTQEPEPEPPLRFGLRTRPE